MIPTSWREEREEGQSCKRSCTYFPESRPTVWTTRKKQTVLWWHRCYWNFRHHSIQSSQRILTAHTYLIKKNTFTSCSFGAISWRDQSDSRQTDTHVITERALLLVGTRCSWYKSINNTSWLLEIGYFEVVWDESNESREHVVVSTPVSAKPMCLLSTEIRMRDRTRESHRDVRDRSYASDRSKSAKRYVKKNGGRCTVHLSLLSFASVARLTWGFLHRDSGSEFRTEIEPLEAAECMVAPFLTQERKPFFTYSSCLFLSSSSLLFSYLLYLLFSLSLFFFPLPLLIPSDPLFTISSPSKSYNSRICRLSTRKGIPRWD